MFIRSSVIKTPLYPSSYITQPSSFILNFATQYGAYIRPNHICWMNGSILLLSICVLCREIMHGYVEWTPHQACSVDVKQPPVEDGHTYPLHNISHTNKRIVFTICISVTDALNQSWQVYYLNQKIIFIFNFEPQCLFTNVGQPQK